MAALSLGFGCEFQTQGETSATGLAPGTTGGETVAPSDDDDVSASGTTDPTSTTSTTSTSNGVTTSSDVTGSTITITDSDGSSEETGEPPIPPQCQETGYCVQSPPTDWLGPVGVGLTASGSALLECPDGFSEVLRGSRDINAPDPTCGCDCNPDAAGCSVDFEVHSTDACDAELVATTVTSTCQQVSLGESPAGIIASVATPSGSCAPTQSEDIAPAAFESDVVVCSTAGGMICNSEFGSGFCVGEAEGDLDGRYCIYREGRHDCPADGLYTDRIRVFQGIDDQRACSLCTCLPAGLGDCTGGLGVHGDAACGGSGTAIGTTCTATPALGASFSANYLGEPPEVVCGVAEDSAPTGQATGTGATTLCCSGPV